MANNGLLPNGLTTKTTISVGLVIIIIAMAGSYSVMRAQGNQATTDIAQIKADLCQLPDEFMPRRELTEVLGRISDKQDEHSRMMLEIKAAVLKKDDVR